MTLSPALSNVKKIIERVAPKSLIDLGVRLIVSRLARKANIQLRFSAVFIDVILGNKTIRVAKHHLIYLADIVTQFDYYHSSVTPIEILGTKLVDYSTPRYHEVTGFDLHPVLFPSFAESVVTTNQYLEFSDLSEGSVVIDLGAYSGLSCIIFDQRVGTNGKVIAVDADTQNIDAIRKNFILYQRITGRQINLLAAAVWNIDGELEFSSEGNMGSSATSIVGTNRGNIKKIPAYTLSSIANLYKLAKVDFIKCDVEGAEAVIFQQPEFFSRFRPKIIIEAHIVDGTNTAEACKKILSNFGYQFKKIEQFGSTLPLLECTPVDM